VRPVSRRQGSSPPMSDGRPPAGLVGIPRSLRPLATPTLLASEALESRAVVLECRETSSLLCTVASGAVLVPPTGNRVLNQIPAGDGRESSREQAVPGDGAPLHRPVRCGAGRPPPPSGLSCSWRQSRLPDPQKKKKKKSGMKWSLDPTTTSKLVPSGKFLRVR